MVEWGMLYKGPWVLRQSRKVLYKNHLQQAAFCLNYQEKGSWQAELFMGTVIHFQQSISSKNTIQFSEGTIQIFFKDQVQPQTALQWLHSCSQLASFALELIVTYFYHTTQFELVFISACCFCSYRIISSYFTSHTLLFSCLVVCCCVLAPAKPIGSMT